MVTNMTYRPDCWVIVKISSPDAPAIYKILAGWFGGYLGSNSWRLNSGITSYVINDPWVEFYGESGSAYNCHSSLYGTNSMTGSILEQLKAPNDIGVTVELLSLESFIAEFNNEVV